MPGLAGSNHARADTDAFVGGMHQILFDTEVDTGLEAAESDAFDAPGQLRLRMCCEVASVVEKGPQAHTGSA